MPRALVLSVSDEQGSASIAFDYDGQRRVGAAVLTSSGGTRVFRFEGVGGQRWSVERSGVVAGETVDVSSLNLRLSADLSMPFSAGVG